MPLPDPAVPDVPPRRSRLGSRLRLALTADTPFTTRQRLTLLVAFALLVILRLPGAWTRGRFLGEEGVIFFAYAWHRPAGEALARSFGGYLNLGANASTLLAARSVRAGLLPLEAAPWLTMTLALAVQTLPAALILTARAPWLARRGAVLGALLALVVLPFVEEVFSNVLHIQFHLALCAALILAVDVPAGRWRQVACLGLLIVAPLCGPGAIILLPFFAIRAAVERDPGRAVQFAAFALGAAVQLLFFFVPSPARGQLLDPATLGAVTFVRLVALPFGGPWLGKAIGTGVYHSYAAGGAGWGAAAATMAGYAAALVGVAVTRPRYAAAWLIVPALTLAAVSFGGGMLAIDTSEWFNPGAAERYNFLPLVLTTLGLIALAERRAGWPSRACRWLVLLTLGWGVAGFAFPIAAVNEGPRWLDEVAAWRRDHRHPLATWPDTWRVDLSDDDRPCPPPRAGASARRDPSYCESHWLQHVADANERVRREAR